MDNTAVLFEKRSGTVKKLIQYIPAKEIMRVKKGTHIRYFTEDQKGRWVFRSGGFLIKKSKENVVLTNGSISWVVKKKGVSFWKKISAEKVQEIYSSQAKTDRWVNKVTKELAKMEKTKNGLGSLPVKVRKRLKKKATTV